MDNCFGLIRPHQLGIANTQAQESRAEFLEAWLAVTQVKYHDNP